MFALFSKRKPKQPTTSPNTQFYESSQVLTEFYNPQALGKWVSVKTAICTSNNSTDHKFIMP